jgi:hypothetical protein
MFILIIIYIYIYIAIENSLENDDTSNTVRAGGPLSAMPHEAECSLSKSLDQVHVCFEL